MTAVCVWVRWGGVGWGWVGRGVVLCVVRVC